MKSLQRISFSWGLGVAILAIPSVPVLAADTAADSAMVNPANIKWGEAPPTLTKGAKIAVLNGDPGKSGPYTMRLMMPAGYKLAPHWHTQAENLTVISGAFYLGMGEKAEASKAQALQAGGYHYLPPKVRHYAYTKAPTVVQVNGEGPFDINYVNPEDDPSKAKK